MRNRERKALVTMEWNPFVSGILDTFYDERNAYMMLEYSPCGTFQLLLEAGPLPPSHAIFYFANIVCGLEFLEKSGIVHRDIKPHNILVGSDGYLSLCDFGGAQDIPGAEDVTNPMNWQPEGTLAYLAPETIAMEGQPADIQFGPALDWWSAGVILFEMVAGRQPFKPPKVPEGGQIDFTAESYHLWDQIMAGPPVWPGEVRIGRKLKALVRDLLTVNVKERLGADGARSVMENRWLATVDWTKMRRRRYLVSVAHPLRLPTH
jgi:protein kinase X